MSQQISKVRRIYPPGTMNAVNTPIPLIPFLLAASLQLLGNYPKSLYRPHTPQKALDETAQESECNYWILFLFSVPSISCQLPVAQGDT